MSDVAHRLRSTVDEAAAQVQSIFVRPGALTTGTRNIQLRPVAPEAPRRGRWRGLKEGEDYLRSKAPLSCSGCGSGRGKWLCYTPASWYSTSIGPR